MRKQKALNAFGKSINAFGHVFGNILNRPKRPKNKYNDNHLSLRLHPTKGYQSKHRRY